MKTIYLLILISMVQLSNAQQSNDVSQHIISLEKAALERWNKGDVEGFLALSADDVTYFDPYLDKRLDGLEKLKAMYRPLAGQINVTRYEMVNPKVVVAGNAAVLTFNLNSYEGDRLQRWNCTEVYRKEKDNNWKIIQTHWSLTKPELKQTN